MGDKTNIPNSWKELKVEDVSLKIHYGYTASSTKTNTGIKFLRITDIQDYKVNWDDVPFCEIDDYDIEKYILKEGDIVFARTGATVI
jgi:type I restriction enzyme S subunit